MLTCLTGNLAYWVPLNWLIYLFLYFCNLAVDILLFFSTTFKPDFITKKQWKYRVIILLLTTSDTDLSYSLGAVPVDLDVYYVVQWMFWSVSSGHAHTTNISLISRLPLKHMHSFAAVSDFPLCFCGECLCTLKYLTVFPWWPGHTQFIHISKLTCSWHFQSECSSFVPINPLIWSNRLTVSFIQFIW